MYIIAAIIGVTAVTITDMFTIHHHGDITVRFIAIGRSIRFRAADMSAGTKRATAWFLARIGGVIADLNPERRMNLLVRIGSASSD